MESKYPVVEGIFIALSFAVYIGYHLAFFGLKQSCLHRPTPKDCHSINGKGKLARIIFSYLVTSKSKFGILGIQQSRNAMMGATFQASIAALFFNAVLDILLSPSKLESLQRFARHDPLLQLLPDGLDDGDIGLVTPLSVLVLNLVIVLVSLLLFVVCVRLYIHMGYFYRAAADSHGHIGVSDAVELTLQAQVVYTIGQRMIFFFPAAVMWLLGPTALLITSVLVTAGVAMLDRWDPRKPEQHVAEVLTPRRAAAQAASRSCRRTAAAPPPPPDPVQVEMGQLGQSTERGKLGDKGEGRLWEAADGLDSPAPEQVMPERATTQQLLPVARA